MANVYDVADFFIELTGQDDEGEITNLKLNKLLYFAQGHSLAKTGKPLFDEAIEAWDLGPVVPSVYHKYKICGRNPIAAVEKDVSHSFTDEEYDLLLDAAREYCKYTAAYLVKRTHKPGTPWAQTSRNAVIDNRRIADYFSKNERIVSFDAVLAQKNIPEIGRRDADGYLVLPSDEKDDYWDKYDEM
jgi:uncharacterized phage-associated protein